MIHLHFSGDATLVIWIWVHFVGLTPPLLPWSCNPHLRKAMGAKVLATFKTCQVRWGKNTRFNPWPLMRSSPPWQRFGLLSFVENQINFQGDPEYNAFERDIAVVNLFFPDSTVFGQYLKVKLTHILCTIYMQIIMRRVWEIPKDDLVWLHLQLGRVLRTLPRNQLRLRRRNPLLVLHQTLQELCNLNKNFFCMN